MIRNRSQTNAIAAEITGARSSGWTRIRFNERMAILGIAVFGLLIRIRFGPHARDDAYITLRYVDHLATGLGFTYNTGERVLGTTTPLFTLILAALARLGVNPSASAVGIGIVADTAVILILWGFARRIAGPFVGVTAALVYALITPTVVSAVSGMETPLYLLLILVAFLLANTNRVKLCAIVCGLLALIRPDGLMVPAILIAWGWWSQVDCPGQRRDPRSLIGRAVTLARSNFWAALAFAMVVMPWVAFAWSYFGSPVPQSMVAKWNTPQVGPLGSLLNFGRYFLDTDERWFLPLTILAGVGAWGDLRQRRSSYPILIWGALYTMAFLAASKFEYPDAPFEWYFLPLMLPYSLAVAAGWRVVIGWVGKRQWRGQAMPLAGKLAPALLFATFSIVHLNHERSLQDQFLGGRETLYLQMADRLHNHYGITEDILATPEIGALGYGYPGPILDLNGLVTLAAVGRSHEEMIQAIHPPWLVAYYPALREDFVGSPWFQTHYRPVFVLENWETRRTTLYRWYPPPEPTQPNGPSLGGELELLGRRLAWRDSSGGGVLHVELAWRARKTPRQRVSISAQVFGSGDEKLAQQDNEPQEGTFQVTRLREGEMVTDQYDLTIPRQRLREVKRLAIIGYATTDPSRVLPWESETGDNLGGRLDLPTPPYSNG